ncbi:SNF2 family N-terminal domain-containing protein [Fusarium solani]|uniref:SNF2 family N-terminal domain-containing protein n=1 Tax=Fusarium solani TaxID=169388 RepID=A0A9P9G3D7_FUSSL|nr:SNF2 family N-terminal domain-containing protein [Fusarium solani]KAH7231488.1 SNF2 family N-terminal domain-containing protein [Fusarium solani]
MYSKRQFKHHNDAINADAKRRQLEPFSDLTSPGLSSGTHSHVTSGSIRSENRNEIYGILCEVQAKLICSLGAGTEAISSVGPYSGPRVLRFCLFDIILRDGILGFAVPNVNAFAMVDAITSKKLEALQGHTTVCIKAVIEGQTLVQLASKKKAKEPFAISLNVYGTESDAHDIRERLSKEQAFLQHPFYLEDGIEYWNPQFFDLGDTPKYLTHLVGMNESEIQAKRLSDAIQDVLTSLDHGILTETTNAPEIMPSSDLKTPLMRTDRNSYQKAALLFIRQRENREYCQQVIRELRFHIAIPSVNAVPSMAMGGILADVMGLGKTLTILVSIAASRLAAADFQMGGTDFEAIQSTYHRTSATLVIVTSTHGSLRVLIFHGESRPTLPTAMKDHDIVLTTFATLIADFKRGKVLHNMEWFRVIRNQSSKQFKAIERLATERRWCLSGTPIQNSINDLVSLLRFLRFEPFSHPTIFQRHILGPLSEDTLKRAKPLQILLRGVCLRRTQKYLNLPEAHYEHIKLSLGPDEQALYDEVLQNTRREIDELVSNRAKTKSLQPPGILANTCTELLCDYCNGVEEESMAKLNGDYVCPECHRSLSESSPGSSASRSPLRPGLSTKLAFVADNICRRSKSLVFSYWTSTLDLLQDLMSQKHIVARRIDGSLSNKDRVRALEEFQKDQSVSVLLITVQTGAVGLTLTVATQVHIVEPQWNPSVEEQAIARALRMGQTKPVKVFRYMMENTVEEEMEYLATWR